MMKNFEDEKITFGTIKGIEINYSNQETNENERYTLEELLQKIYKQLDESIAVVGEAEGTQEAFSLPNGHIGWVEFDGKAESEKLKFLLEEAQGNLALIMRLFQVLPKELADLSKGGTE
ncbi:hypothetical protein [Streptococcus sp. NLN76]|uniref:hypothetical protein n=1 Tax=Streptococcus sp. NLN76 TaxID=2822800 RepID=UPI0018A973BB|nr:hypothetical protein [Streptococcus sp. NLN76]MBF8969548.1 hypothetical protein [Streptococcus sp. NLN76]